MEAFKSNKAAVQESSKNNAMENGQEQSAAANPETAETGNNNLPDYTYDEYDAYSPWE